MTEPLTILGEPSPCEYRPDQQQQLRHDVILDLAPEDYSQRLQEGWRRFGPVVFRPECPSCRRCQSLRVEVSTFRPSASQRRVWNRNIGEVTVRIGSPSESPEKVDLFAKFHQHGHQAKGWPEGEDPDLTLFLANPFHTEEWTYHVGDRLVGVGYVDALPEGLSAIYFYWDPAESRRSLGTFNILATIASARHRGLPHMYLGYHVEGCRSLEYKARFRPNEVLAEDGTWVRFQPISSR
ncbi:MAG TPA: arginyltransferase [Vicinamibacterales bacterium]|nr:arginyltransferase [Vicinamibacterales bacterium]